MKVQSTTFRQGEAIPETMVFNGMGRTGENRSPQLSWSDVPDGTKSFAVVIHDPDAPTSGGFYHWVLFNIPGDVRELALGAGTGEIEKTGAVHGHTDFGTHEYGGPCPPPGPAHHYNLTLYALGTDRLPLDGTTTGAKLEFMTIAHRLATAHLTGLYKSEGPAPVVDKTGRGIVGDPSDVPSDEGGTSDASNWPHEDVKP
ncbi:MAG TPA: YbhB/YbcL family Raf kinase inhibitor-like protein [Verrucomicrobiae bacterium]|nr:YbhB/YbcL family Raf kinase inhibitor-like protein [Verrucomicrobiae bacterium]